MNHDNNTNREDYCENDALEGQCELPKVQIPLKYPGLMIRETSEGLARLGQTLDTPKFTILLTVATLAFLGWRATCQTSTTVPELKLIGVLAAMSVGFAVFVLLKHSTEATHGPTNETGAQKTAHNRHADSGSGGARASPDEDAC